MKKLSVSLALSTVSLLPFIAHSAESKCVSLEPGRVFFLASEVNHDFACARRGGVDYFVHKVMSMDGETIQVKNLENGVVWTAKKGLCGASTQDEAQGVTQQMVSECKSKQKR